MKRIAVLLAFLLVFAMMLLPMGALATESGADFSDVDWSTVDWNTIDLIEWLNWLDEAELKTLFQMSPYCDAGRSEGIASELGRRFRIDPQGVIMALTAEDAEVQRSVIYHIIYNSQYDRAGFVQLMNSLALPEDAGPVAMNILVQMVNRAEETWGMDITNPHTGDLIGIAALLMAASGLGSALLLKRRKTIA
jgi:hypothetical protein